MGTLGGAIAVVEMPVAWGDVLDAEMEGLGEMTIPSDVGSFVPRP